MLSVRLLRISGIFLAALSVLAAEAGAGTIVFQRGNGIYLRDGDGSRLVCRGYDPEISPDGARIAFTRAQGDNRYIAVYDLAAKTTRVMRDFGDNNYGPRWSRDGSRILFSHFTGDTAAGPCFWKAGVMNADGTGARLVLDTDGSDQFSPAWAGDGKIIFQDLQDATLAASDGDAETLPLPRLANGCGVSSAMRFALSPDGKKIAFDVDVLSEEAVGGSPVSAVFVLDLETRSPARVTPRGISALSPCWLNDGELLFERFGETRDICRIKLDGTGLETVVKNGSRPSCSGSAAGTK